MKLCIPTAIVLSAVVTQTVLSAGLVLQPAGLNPGDEYRLIFTTSVGRDALSPDIDDYNAFVQAVADAAPVLGSWDLEWRAIASTRLVDARDNTNSNPLVVGSGVPIYRVDGEPWVEDYEHLWGEIKFGVQFGSRRSRFSDLTINELGTSLPPDTTGEGIFVFTGTHFNGVAFRNPLDPGELAVIVGYANTKVPTGFTEFSVAPRATLPFFALSEVITAVPEPSSLSLLSLALCSLGILRRRR